MARRIPLVIPALTLVGLLGFAASPSLPREHWQAPDALAGSWLALGSEDAESRIFPIDLHQSTPSDEKRAQELMVI